MRQTHAAMPCTASTRVAMWRSGGVVRRGELVEWCDVEECLVHPAVSDTVALCREGHQERQSAPPSCTHLKGGGACKKVRSDLGGV